MSRPDEADPGDRAMDAQRDERLACHIAGLGRPVRRALDLGCGRGEALGRLGLPGVGVDVGLVRLRLAPGPVAQADGTRLPFPAGTFNVVLLANVVSSVPDSTRREALASEVRRVLADDGVIVWYDQRWPNPANRATRPVRRRELGALFPGWAVEVEPVTLVPALARTLPRSYHLLHRLRLLRSHLVGVLLPPG